MHVLPALASPGLAAFHFRGPDVNGPQPSIRFMKKIAISTIVALGATLSSTVALACASCGCSLSSDWESQGLGSEPGLRFDLRLDAINQDQVRSGTGKAGTWPVAGHEQELYTHNRYLTGTVDYSSGADWGVSLQVPIIQRSHATNGFNFDGTDAGTSNDTSLGDVKVIGRYQGFNDEKNIGVQFGLKLPTGSFTRTFTGGPLAGEPLDRGLQPGTGTTDLILGLYHFAPISQNWDYFVQAMAQAPLNSRDDYRPGSSLNVNVGWRYLGLDKFVPQLQLNARAVAKDSGANASPDDSGGKTLYLSPGVTYALSEKTKLYAFMQVPVYQNLNGFQLAPRVTASVGVNFAY